MNLGNEPTTLDKMKNIASDIGENTTQTFNNVSENVKQGLSTVKDNIDKNVNDFSSNSTVVASSKFLEANTILAKFSFLICVVVAFLILFNLGMQIIGYFFSTSPNPYLIRGQIEASTTYTIIQDPTKKATDQSKESVITIPRSNNAVSGIEFTWSVWISLSTQTKQDGKYLNVFNKGDLPTNANIFGINNAPGVFVGPSKTNDSLTYSNSQIPLQTNSVWILMDTVALPSNTGITYSDNVFQRDQTSTEYIEITNMPINKYFHLAIRCQNKFIDVYINGNIVSHTNLMNVPKQNFYDVNIGDINFDSKSYISDLRYFSSALSVIDINNIVTNGPNTKNALMQTSFFPKYSQNYLSNMWYQSKISPIS
jgi:hypothetical protein